MTYIDDVLLDVAVRATDAADFDADKVFLHNVTCKLAGLLGEGGREHKVGVVGVNIGIFIISRV